MSDFNVSESNPQELPDPVQNEEASSLFTEETMATVPKKPKRSFVKELVEYAEIFVFAMGLVLVLLSFVFRICTVKGPSMENTLIEGDQLLVTDVFYTPKRGDVVIFHQIGDDAYDLNEPIVKRVIATAGERVDLIHEANSMRVLVTDAEGNTYELDESEYMQYVGRPLYSQSMSFVVPEGSLFVMGDNRNNSLDSRSNRIGMVDQRSILGKVILKLPF